MQSYREDIAAYCPENPQEERDRQVLMGLIASGQELRFRENPICHLTASSWITNSRRDQVLMAWHNLYRSWSWLGGHADGEDCMLRVALREAREEAGLLHVKPLSEELFSLEILAVEGHEKHGVYVPCHLHLNLTYLLEAHPEEELHHKEDENSVVQWFPLRDAVEASCEPWFRERIYSKLNRKLLQWKEQGKI